MKLTDAIAKLILGAAMTADLSIPKRDDEECHEHSHDEVLVDDPPMTGIRFLPDEVVPTPFTIRRHEGGKAEQRGAEITDYAYSWRAVAEAIRIRFAHDNQGAVMPEPVITQHQDEFGKHWLSAFELSGAKTVYKIQQWVFCDPNLRISHTDKNFRAGWFDTPPT